MVGTLAQIISLTAYGNDYLKNNRLPFNFFATNSTFGFCNHIHFSIFSKPWLYLQQHETIIATEPTDWFRHLKKHDCKALRLFYEPSKNGSHIKDYQLAGFVGGVGIWHIEAAYRSYSNYWMNRWEVTNRNAPDKRIWNVVYGMLNQKQPTNNIQLNIESVKANLLRTLEEIAEFAARHDEQTWTQQFEKAKATLDSKNPHEGFYHLDLIPLENYSLIAKQILFAAAHAFVFGGMSSWNDLGFQPEEEHLKYSRLSEQLYANINEAVVAAVNSY